MKKQVAVLFTSALCFCGSLFSETKVQSGVKPNGCEGNFLVPSYSSYGMGDKCDFKNGGHFEVGLLFQQPWIYGMVSGSKSVANIFPNGVTSFSQEQTISVIEESFNYSAGLTVGLGYMMDYDGWFLKGDFDWLSSTISNRSHNDYNTYYYIINQLAAICTNNADKSLANLVFNAKVNFYALDVLLSRGSFHSSSFSFEPFVGVKALWYDGNYSSNTGEYGAGVANLYTSFTLATFYDAWGVGPMFGFNGEYYLFKNLSIFSDNDFAVLYGGMNFRTNASGILVSPAPTNVCNNLNSIENSDNEYFIPVRTILGLKYGAQSKCGKHYLAIKAGYDARYVFARAVVPDFAMNGLYLSFIWDF